MTPVELVATIRDFAARHGEAVPCGGGVDTSPISSLRLEEDEGAELQEAESQMAELEQLRKQITAYFVLGPARLQVPHEHTDAPPTNAGAPKPTPQPS